MPTRKKKNPLLITDVSGENAMEIHVYGDLLSNAVFLRIVEIMKENKESENPKNVRFVVNASTMYTAVRYAIPSNTYEKIEIRSAKSEEGGMKDASGM